MTETYDEENKKFEACFDAGYDAAMDYSEYSPAGDSVEEKQAWIDGWNQAQDELDDEFDEDDEDDEEWDDDYEDDDYEDEEFDNIDEDDWDDFDNEELETV